MGASQSDYVIHQEEFVRNNYKKVADELKYIEKNYSYSRGQIEGKLRQCYAGTDTTYDNRNSFITQYNWSKVKKNCNL